MPIDAYSLCPGGTGKKVKFCCPDRIHELDELDRMIQGGQHLAALRQIESLEHDGEPPRACLLAWKIQLLRDLERGDEEVDAAVALFVEHFPDNPLALAESAVQTALTGDGPAAMRTLQKALAGTTEMPTQVYGALGVVAESLLAEGHFLAARALWGLQLAIYREDKTPAEALTMLAQSAMVPLLLKAERPWDDGPDGVPWKARFDEATHAIAHLRWAEAAERLTALAEEATDAPAVWHNLALVRGWLADEPGAADAWRKLATLDIPLEDAAEYTAMAMLVSDDPLGDQADLLRATFVIQDADHLTGLLSTWPHAVRIPVDPREFDAGEGQEEVPPKAQFQLTDKPLPDSAEGLTLDGIPRVLGQVRIFGRQTDRPARLVLTTFLPATQAEVVDLLRRIVPDELNSEPQTDVAAHDSATQALFRRPWRLPQDMTPQQLRDLFDTDLEQALLERWPKISLGCLDGRTPEQAAREPERRVALLAAILVLRDWLMPRGRIFDLNRLRSKLGLPTLDPIDPTQGSLETTPLTRLHRVMVDKLPDDALLHVFFQGAFFNEMDVIRRAGREAVDRPSVPSNDRRTALETLIRIEDDLDQVFADIDLGRRLAEEAGQSSAAWDLLELDYRFMRRDEADILRLINHLQSAHGKELGVMQALARLLVSKGIGRPAGGPGEAMDDDDFAEEEPGEPAGPGLWTPGSDQPTQEGSKLWIPGAEE